LSSYSSWSPSLKGQVAPNIVCGPPLAERLELYFLRSELRAKHIVNNDLDPGPIKAGTEKVELGGVIVEWISTLKPKYEVDIAIKINGYRLELKNQKSTNLADEDRAIEPTMVDQWDQIRLYDLGNDRRVVAITLRPRMCTGLMCGVAAQLYFDLKSKKAALFGTYRTDGEAKLYSFGPDGNEAFVVATNFAGDPHGTVAPLTLTYELYRLIHDGRFVHEKYFIKHIQQPEKSDKTDTVEERWIERLRLDQ
jgi:hypothetical protein